MRAVVNNRKKLKGKDLKAHGAPGKVVIFESMSPHFKNLHWRCTQLKKGGHIKDWWFFNGKYNLLMNTEERKSIVHIEDLEKLLQIDEEHIDKICDEWKDKPFGRR